MVSVVLKITPYEWRKLNETLNHLSLHEITINEIEYDQNEGEEEKKRIHPIIKLILIQIFEKRFAGKSQFIRLKLDIIQLYALWHSGICSEMFYLHQELIKLINTHNAELEKAGVLIRKPPAPKTSADWEQEMEDVFHDLNETFNKLPLQKITGDL
jgi:hypothetical protein